VSELFQNKYRTKSHRLPGWDYSTDGYYFITICTQNRENIFGEIKNDTRILNDIGEIVEKNWRGIAAHFSHAKPDEFVVMPNHLHGIIVIDNANSEISPGVTTPRVVETPMVTTPRVAETPMVETPHWGVSTNKIRNPHHKPEWKSGTIGVIINQFKSICTKQIHQIYPALDRIWQPRFHDRVICDEDELNRIREYVRQNPENWERDSENQ
jgi:putative transposase